jgi:hypothetical protein
MVFNLSGYGQCGVRDLPDSTQKMILGKFLLLDQCDTLRKIDSIHIDRLMADKRILQEENKVLRVEVDDLKETALNRRKWPWISGAVGLIGGFFIGTRIR